MKTVSIVVPCYNLGEYLPEAVESVRAQTYQNREIIIVNDGSTDERTLHVLGKYERDGLPVYHTENRGASAARNYGIERARGDYILCLDADDVLLPTYLEETVAKLDQMPDVGIVATHVEFFGSYEGFWHVREHSPVALLARNCIPSASLFRKLCWQQVGGYKDLPACQDWEFWLSVVVERGWKSTVVPKRLYRYRQRGGSISEYRESHHPEILSKMIELHADSYRTHALEIIIEMDAEIQKLRQLLRKVHTGKNTDKECGAKDLQEQINRIRAVVRSKLPVNSKIIVVSKGDDELIKYEGREGWHFPQTSAGVYAGHHPATSTEAIADLERLRMKGGEFFLIPETALWWLEYYDEFRQHLEQSYRVVTRQKDACVIFHVRNESVRHSFSVVICTYKRASILRKAIESVFKQEYPKDKYQIIIVNNDSPDNTEEIIEELATRSPVSFSHYVEKRNGLSYARNLGISKSTFEYVAFLDDDAIACPTWLAALNAVINEHHALVVGGRVEKSFEDDSKAPDWFRYQYVNHFFGVNYRDRGKREKVFRIQYPLYLSGGNIAYARRLFDHFGGFDVRLGRDGKTLLAGEETYFHFLLGKNDIPMYYTDDAYIIHYIESYRVTKSHIRRKAYWSGVTSSLMYPMFFGFEGTLDKTKDSWRELGTTLLKILGSPRSAENFSRACRIIYNLAFLYRFYRRYFTYKLTTEHIDLPEVTWTTQDWIEEISHWPEDEDKYEQLFHLYVSTGDTGKAQEAFEKLRQYLPTDANVESAKSLDKFYGPLRRLMYQQLIHRIREIVDAAIPSGCKTAVISKGDEEMTRLNGSKVVHFPQNERGVYAGYHPGTSAEAIAHLEALRAKGTDYLLIPSTAFWWLDYYPEFRDHLEKNYTTVVRDENTCILFALQTREYHTLPRSHGRAMESSR
jgi:glycosyltransferase involved in cell wall biosynthesis